MTPQFPMETPAGSHRRRRGGLLIDIVLGLLLLVGLLYGAYSYFQQGSASKEQAEINARFVALAADVRSQFLHETSYGHNIDITDLVRNRSSLPEIQFRNVVITGRDTGFRIQISNISQVVCNRIRTSADVGPRGSVISSPADCTPGRDGYILAAYDS